MKKSKEHILQVNFNKPENPLSRGSANFYVLGKGIKEFNERLS